MSRVTVYQVGPRDALERSVRRIWAEVLGRRDFGVYDNFFDAGGDSFAMVLVQAKIAQQLGYELPLTALFSAPTIAAVAVLLRGGSGGAPTALVQLSRRDTSTAVFCLHPLGGSAAVYHPLAQALTSHTCFGLQALGLASGVPPLRSLDAMAATYADAILSVQAQGPHYLVGYSLGGRLAIAVAQQIQNRGHGSPVVLLLDSFADGEIDAAEPYRAIGAYALHLQMDYDALAALGRDRAISAIYEQAIRQNTFGPDFELSRLVGIFETAMANMHAVAEVPLRPYAGEAVLIRSTPQDDTTDWAAFFDKITTYSLPFPHAMMLEEKPARRIAALLAPHLT